MNDDFIDFLKQSKTETFREYKWNIEEIRYLDREILDLENRKSTLAKKNDIRMNILIGIDETLHIINLQKQ